MFPAMHFDGGIQRAEIAGLFYRSGAGSPA
jgi:hypothetical protein